MLNVSRADLLEMAPRPSKAGVRQAAWNGYVEAMTSPAFAELLARFEINTPRRLQQLMAQWSHESGGFTIIFESGAYSAPAIMDKFGVGRHSACVTQEEALRIAALPNAGDERARALFDRVYGVGNPEKAEEFGHTEPGDGYRYRGVAIGQITGRKDQERYAAQIGCAVSELALPINGCHAALLEWKAKRCNALADRNDIYGITKKINGGLNGYEDRCERLVVAQRVFGDEDDDVLELMSVERMAEIQTRLQSLNYTLGETDGKEDVASRSAVFAFQDANGLEPTGVVDAVTAAAIMAPTAAKLPVSPERASITAKELAARGSTSVQSANRDQEIAKWTIGSALVTILDDFSGGAVLDVLESGADKANGLLGKFGGSLANVPAKYLLCGAAIGGAAYLYQLAAVRRNKRVEKAREGRDMSI